MLQVSSLTKKFLNKTVVDNISFDLKKGEILGFLGPNGAGKTTVMQMLLGLLLPTHGSIKYFGIDFLKNSCSILRKIGYASGYDKLPARLTVLENLDIIGRIYNIPKSLRDYKIENLLRSFGIWENRNQETGGLSAGQSTRVMLSKVFIADPEIVLLDEPTASLDPEVAYQVRQFILAQRVERNISILITSHNMNEVSELCNRILVIKKGIIIANDTPSILANSISKVKVELNISSSIDNLIKYLCESGLIYNIQNSILTIKLDESFIAQFLANLSERKILYSHISIERPTLEDYFLSVAKRDN